MSRARVFSTFDENRVSPVLSGSPTPLCSSRRYSADERATSSESEFTQSRSLREISASEGRCKKSSRGKSTLAKRAPPPRLLLTSSRYFPLALSLSFLLAHALSEKRLVIIYLCAHRRCGNRDNFHSRFRGDCSRFVERICYGHVTRTCARCVSSEAERAGAGERERKKIHFTAIFTDDCIKSTDCIKKIHR